MAHGGKEGVDTSLVGSMRNLVNVFFSLNSSEVVIGEEDLDDRVKLEVHHLFINLFISLAGELIKSIFII